MSHCHFLSQKLSLITAVLQVSPVPGCSSPCLPCASVSLNLSSGTRTPGAADPSGRDAFILDAGSQAADDVDALDFFQQQDLVDGADPSSPSSKDEPTGKAQEQEEEEEEEELLDPLGIMR